MLTYLGSLIQQFLQPPAILKAERALETRLLKRVKEHLSFYVTSSGSGSGLIEAVGDFEFKTADYSRLVCNKYIREYM